MRRKAENKKTAGSLSASGGFSRMERVSDGLIAEGGLIAVSAMDENDGQALFLRAGPARLGEVPTGPAAVVGLSKSAAAYFAAAEHQSGFSRRSVFPRIGDREDRMAGAPIFDL